MRDTAKTTPLNAQAFAEELKRIGAGCIGQAMTVVAACRCILRVAQCDDEAGGTDGLDQRPIA